MSLKNLLTILSGGMLILILGVGLGMQLYVYSIKQESEQITLSQHREASATSDCEPSCEEALPCIASKSLPAIIRYLSGFGLITPQ